MGWTVPAVLSELGAGRRRCSIAFAIIETRVADPMFRLPLFRIRAFTAGVLASFLAAVGRGGLMFMLIIWLQGIWLPLHGYDFARTPLWAGIAMLPLTTGFLISGPVSGVLSDRYGARPFATGGMLGSAASFVALELLPVNFSYWVFGLILLHPRPHHGGVRLSQPGRGHEQPPSPAPRRGIGDELHLPELGAGPLHRHLLHAHDRGDRRRRCPTPMYHGLVAQGVPTGVADRVAHLPPVSTLFAAFLGYNPMQHLLGNNVLAHLPAGHRAVITGRSFFPNLIAAPFRQGLHAAFDFAIVACLVAAGASWMRGGKYVYVEPARTGEGDTTSGGHDDDGQDRDPMAGPSGPSARDDTPAVTTRRTADRVSPCAAPTLRIGEVAKLCGVTTRTLRYWEEIGLLAPSEPAPRQRTGLRRLRGRTGQAHPGAAGAHGLLPGRDPRRARDRRRRSTSCAAPTRRSARPELQRAAAGQRHGGQRQARGPSRRHPGSRSGRSATSGSPKRSACAPGRRSSTRELEAAAVRSVDDPSSAPWARRRNRPNAARRSDPIG